jgi:hypothetical protein
MPKVNDYKAFITKRLAKNANFVTPKYISFNTVLIKYFKKGKSSYTEF